MYSFNQEEISTIQAKALNHLGQPMKYKELCTELNIPYFQQAKTRQKQLRDLQITTF